MGGVLPELLFSGIFFGVRPLFWREAAIFGEFRAPGMVLLRDCPCQNGRSAGALMGIKKFFWTMSLMFCILFYYGCSDGRRTRHRKNHQRKN